MTILGSFFRKRMFISDVIVGNGSLQEIEHGLGRTPKAVFAFPVDMTHGILNAWILNGSDNNEPHDASVVKFHAGNDLRYRIIAIA